ncbi:hypothetical protein [Neolewinella litorea]|uniref:Uncharacterized protein n=1 Tax=Neolewinella litorea TaxID=2562452 RepID=A0A4S4NE03_9BACT|nr:hypothetical protein [Neolewinella litorea]THH37752.1 hypothetical protein E4021_13750 [Neolewinella litorea]
MIFLLLGGYPAVKGYETDLRLLIDDSRSYRLLFFLYMTGRTAYLALLVCLLLHVVIRGLWIAAVGLRYVSGDIDYEVMKFRPRYTRWLEGQIGSFDDYIERLERYSSVLFSLAFLVLFCFLSIGSWILVMIALQEGYNWLLGRDLSNSTGILRGAGVFTLLLLLLSLIYFLDFVTLGFFKRNRYTARPYYYLYRVMGWITLADLYRPLYYNLIDHRFGRRLARLVPVVVVLLLVAVSFVVVKYRYYPFYLRDGLAFVDAENYLDTDGWTGTELGRITLESRYPRHNYVEAFVPYRPYLHDEILEKLAPELEVARYTGAKLSGAFTVGERSNAAADNQALLAAFSDLFSLSVNDSLLDPTPRFHIHPVRQQPGLLYMIPVHDLPRGEHILSVRSRQLRSDTLGWSSDYNIYFYK